MRIYWEATFIPDEPNGWSSEIPGQTGPDKPWWQWPLMAHLRLWRVRLRIKRGGKIWYTKADKAKIHRDTMARVDAAQRERLRRRG